MNRLKHRLPVAALVAVLLATLSVGVATANLPGSTFEGGDGNVVVDTTGNTDWNSPAPDQHAADDVATGQGDNSFGQGTKENSVNVTVVSGSIPNSKADLGRFAVGSEVIGDDTFLYIAWTRNNLSGTVNFDFEINQAAQPDLTTPGDKTLNRTTGDLLITYDFQGGAQNPTIAAARWLATDRWSSPQSLGTNAAEAEVNRDETITENLTGTGSIDREPFAFGEAAINLTEANLIPSGEGAGCAGFSSIFVKSRASDAFTSAVKDFIAPIPVDLNTCGAIEITKTKKHAAAEGTGEVAHAGVEFEIDGESVGTTNAQGKLCVSGLSQGTYTVDEVVPEGYVSDDASQDVTIDQVGNCTSGAETVSFSNTPLTDVSITIDSQIVGGTDTDIDCTGTALDGNTPDATGDITVSTTDLEPQTIVCTIVIDP